MKRTIYARLLALVVLISLFCTGCSARTPVTAEEFETQASAVGFTVETPSVDPETYVSARTAYDLSLIHIYLQFLHLALLHLVEEVIQRDLGL